MEKEPAGKSSCLGLFSGAKNTKKIAACCRQTSKKRGGINKNKTCFGEGANGTFLGVGEGCGGGGEALCCPGRDTIP